ncbi:MAG: Uma2 family endonuclease [Woronichinia naegeliana WA131]|jgi:Uma2 family endonuclease|uniref:Uma2 family endonuclease n=1 Tax=Woronichinia naegeliana WA131 TaxID=2824559 RepID=A0A977PU89_9CYAN|nr:MAG: Uma2 family endonuclease [Woronichinia naegeliana WA131]
MNTTLKLEPAIALSENQFFTLCQQNPDLKIERSGQGELIIMPPTGGETGRKNAELIADFIIWNRQSKLGIVFDSSTCFRLPKGGDRSPDLSWLKKERWDGLTSEQKRKFPPLCPDFVLELLSPSDNLSLAQAKMQEYQANGVQLAWLLNPQDQQVEIYRLGYPVEILFRPRELFGENVLPNFVLNIAWLWQ